MDEGLTLRLGADVALLLRQVEGVSGSIVLNHVRVIDRDVGRLLVEIVDRVSAFAHYLGHETICVAHRPRRIVDKRSLHRPPAFGVFCARFRRQCNDVELLSLSFARNEFLFAGALITGLAYGSLVLWTEVFLQSLGPLTTVRDLARITAIVTTIRTAAAITNQLQTGISPDLLVLTGYPRVVCRNVNFVLHPRGEGGSQTRIRCEHSVFKVVAALKALGDSALSLLRWTRILALPRSEPPCAVSGAGRYAGYNVVSELLGEPMLPLRIPWYVTVLGLGPAGAVYTEGWDRQVAADGAEAKATKRTINTQRIYPPLNGNRDEILAAGSPALQSRPGLGH